MSASPTPYQAFKIWVTSYVPLDNNSFHYLIGLGLVVVAFGMARRGARGAYRWAFVVSAVLAVLMEIGDLYQQRTHMDEFRWGPSGADLIRTTVIPALGWAAASLMRRRRGAAARGAGHGAQ